MSLFLPSTHILSHVALSDFGKQDKLKGKILTLPNHGGCVVVLFGAKGINPIQLGEQIALDLHHKFIRFDFQGA